MRIVLWWSFFTAATGWVWNPSSLIVTRALFGAGEAGAFPNLTRVLTTWLPVKERERAQAMALAGDAPQRRLHADPGGDASSRRSPGAGRSSSSA